MILERERYAKKFGVEKLYVRDFAQTYHVTRGVNRVYHVDWELDEYVKANGVRTIKAGTHVVFDSFNPGHYSYLYGNYENEFVMSVDKFIAILCEMDETEVVAYVMDYFRSHGINTSLEEL